MLTSRNEKELYREFEEQRIEALEDSSSFPATGETYALDDLGITTEGQGINNPATYLIDIDPVDNASPMKYEAFDIRTRMGCGD